MKEKKYNSFSIFIDCIQSGKTLVDPKTILFYDVINFQEKPSDKDYFLSKNTSSNVSYRHFYNATLSDTTYSNDFEKMIALHYKLNTFSPIDYKQAHRDPHYLALMPYQFLERNLFRTDYAERTYFNLFLRLDSVYYFSVFPDKRLKRFSPKRASITIPSRNIFAFRIKDNFYYLHPQNNYATYYLNELPFYFENELVVHIPQNIKSITNCNEINSNIDPIYSYTPESRAEDNTRQIVGIIDIHLQTNEILFKGKISLSGQYSTLLRNFYKNNLIDPSINSLYKNRMSDRADTKSIVYKVLSSSTEYPFKTSISAEFTIPGISTALVNEKIIDISKWFNYVYPDSNFVNTERHQFDFYPDFLGRDKTAYQLKFDSPVEILNLDECNYEIHNDYADFHCFLKKTDNSNYYFDALLEIKADKVDAQNLNQVESITKAIDKISSTKIRFKPI